MNFVLFLAAHVWGWLWPILKWVVSIGCVFGAIILFFAYPAVFYVVVGVVVLMVLFVYLCVVGDEYRRKLNSALYHQMKLGEWYQ